jgi:hypothetical protein
VLKAERHEDSVYSPKTGPISFLTEVQNGLAALKGSAEVTIDKDYTEIPNHSYYAAMNHCFKEGKRLCSRKEICPDGVATIPKRGYRYY